MKKESKKKNKIGKITKQTEVKDNVTIESESLDSIEITKNANGSVSFKVKCYASDVEEALERANKAYDKLTKKFKD